MRPSTVLRHATHMNVRSGAFPVAQEEIPPHGLDGGVVGVVAMRALAVRRVQQRLLVALTARLAPMSTEPLLSCSR